MVGQAETSVAIYLFSEDPWSHTVIGKKNNHEIYLMTMIWTQLSLKKKKLKKKT